MRFIEEPKPKKKKSIIPKLIFGVLAVVFVVAGIMVARYYIIAAQEQKKFDEVAALVIEDPSPDYPDDVVTDKGVMRKYERVYEKNPDFFAWLKIDGTVINYPVMFTPEDPEYYLHRDFDGNYSESGTLFIDGDCDPKGNYFLIYGHHMNSGAMFGTLPNYADPEYYRNHSVIHFDTRTKKGDYTVFAAFYSKAYTEDDTEHFKYYSYKNLSEEWLFDEYISTVKAMSEYDTGITPSFGDEIITLSTCNYHTDNGRFVVVAVKNK